MSKSPLELREYLHLPDELIKALGEVTARSGQIEHLLYLTISRTTELTYEEACTAITRNFRKESRKTARRGFRDWAKKEYGDVEGERRADIFDGLLESWTKLVEQRDEIIHCCWTVGDEGKVGGTRWGGLLVETGGRPSGIKEVQELANELAHILVQVNKATRPEFVSGPEEAVSKIPPSYEPGHVLPAALENRSTAASTQAFSNTVEGSKGRGS